MMQIEKNKNRKIVINLSRNKGFSLAELLISLAILTVVGSALATFQSDIFTLSFSAQANLSAQLDARHVIRQFVAELRESAPSSLGSYPIALASSSAITFFSDLNNDGVEDQVRYYTSGTNLMKGVIYPSGSPLTYNSANEKVFTVVSSVINTASSTSPIFQYYDTNYTGTSSPLTQPVAIPSIRLVKITVIIDKDPNRSPTPITVTTQVGVRNLKDNY